MDAKILRVVKCGEKISVQSEKADNKVLDKRTLVLQELGGRFENQYAVSVLGNLAQLQFYEGDLVMATLRFGCREYNGQMFQDIVATEMIKR